MNDWLLMYENHVWTAVEETQMEVIVAVMNTT